MRSLGEAVGANVYDDALFLFFPEFVDVCGGRKQWKDLQSIATARHEYYDHYNEIRDTLPKVVGTLPDKIEDPVLIEIFGMHDHYFERLKSDPTSTQMSGFPASAGKVTGRARVMVSATELFDLEEGEIRVRSDVAELDTRVRDHRRLRVRRRGLAHARRDREPRVRHPLRGGMLGRDLTDQDR